MPNLLEGAAYIFENLKYIAAGAFCCMFLLTNPLEGAVYVFAYLKYATLGMFFCMFLMTNALEGAVNIFALLLIRFIARFWCQILRNCTVYMLCDTEIRYLMVCFVVHFWRQIHYRALSAFLHKIHCSGTFYCTFLMKNPLEGAVYISVNLKYVTQGTFHCTFLNEKSTKGRWLHFCGSEVT